MQLHTEIVNGFTITLRMEPEDISPDDMFDWDALALEGETGTQCRQRTFTSIENGTLTWCCMAVSASKNGIVLATKYLGGVSIDDPADFINDLYYNDMRMSVIQEARDTINALGRAD